MEQPLITPRPEELTTDSTERGVSEVLRPEVWIGTSEDYDGNRNYGGWIDVTQRDQAVTADIRDVLDRTPGDLGQRWGMYEARGFGYWQPGGEDSLATVMATARRIMEFGLPYSALVGAVGPDSLAVQSDRYKISFVGDWPSLTLFAEQVAADSGWYERLAELPQMMRPYVLIDIEALAAEAQRQLTIVEHSEGVWVFDPRVW